MSTLKDRLICIIAAQNTAEAGFITLTLAEWFGRKRQITHNGVTVTVARWRGKFYFMSDSMTVANEAVKR